MRDKKRLVPHLFTWTQNFFSILLVFKMVEGSEALRAIPKDIIDHEAIQRTTILMLDWLRDVKQFDGIAEWSWKVLDLVYPQAHWMN